ncbi:MAG: hypothetical protein EBU90_09825 [Proteobacteria bacterium]|nr:hypothetical protein [Pseudomonadota bacterium]NBP14550.1 hypothetical protein [bacterium]
MDILYLDNKLSYEVCQPLIIYKASVQPQIKKNQLYETKHWTVNDYDLSNKIYRKFSKSYTNPLLASQKGSFCNYLGIVEFEKYGFLNDWVFLDQIDGQPSTLTFIAKITESEHPVSVEFIRNGRYSLLDYSVIIFPSCFTFAFRINPIQANEETIIVGSILIRK